IYQSKDISDCMPVIQQLYPRLLPIREDLKKCAAEGNDEKFRGYCRIFVEAGECYLKLVVTHSDAFRGIVEGIAECAAYHDLDMVPITFRFWYELANELSDPQNHEAKLRFRDIYSSLVDIMIKHLHYPDDLESWSA